jgi:CheY-like chemotaxis protein
MRGLSFRLRRLCRRTPASCPRHLNGFKAARVDGLEALRRIRSHDLTKRLPVVILTSS